MGRQRLLSCSEDSTRIGCIEELGDLLKCSGWTSALVQAGVATAGTADSFLTAAHITRTRRAYPIRACALYEALEDAYQECAISTEPGIRSHETGRLVQSTEQPPMFKFWFTVLQL